MLRILRLIAASGLALIALSSNANELVLTNGKVYSFAWEHPKLDGTPSASAPFSNGQWQADAQALVINGGEIVYVGGNAEALARATASTKVIDLDGATVLPGLIDSHVHIAELGQILSRTNLIDIATPKEVVATLVAQNAEIKGGEWVLGQGWDEGAWANNYPNRELLDAAFPNNPVFLKSLHGFAVWVNTAALKAASIDRNSAAPVGGEIVKDTSGEPTGIFLNRATTLMQSAVPEPSAEQFKQQVLLGLNRMAQDGYVAVHQAGADESHISAFQELRADKALPIRVYAMLSARNPTLSEQWIKKGPSVDPQGWLDVRSVKAYYDGALGSRGARLLQDYSDKPGHRGVSGDGYGFDGKIVQRLMNAGFQVGVHAIGDAGNRETLDFLAEVYEKHPKTSSLRHRVEHAQIIHADDFQRFAELGLIASMEPPHAVEDKAWAEARLGKDRVKGAYAWRTLRLAGSDITFNSDLPGSDHSIFYGLHAAVTRRDKQAQPSGGWQAQESLSMEESILAYTHWAAYSAFREQQTGRLEAGRWADITIMDIDPFDVSHSAPEELLNGNIVMTIVNGQIVFQADD